MKRNEIGGEFWEIPTLTTVNDLFADNTEWFISGRSALLAIISENSFRTVSLPDWCCESIILPFLKNNIEVSFYDALNPPTNFCTDAILVMDYFGYSSEVSYTGYTGIVIRDVTHSLFTNIQDDADYYFGSLRKWAGFYTGGFAWGFKNKIHYNKSKSDYVVLRKEAMQLKSQYIQGINTSKGYLDVFSKAEDLLDEFGIEPGYKGDVECAMKLDVNQIKTSRRRNAQLLLEAFSDIAVFPEIKQNDCPMFVPIRVGNRDKLRRYLIEREIYCPAHWPLTKFHSISESEKKIYQEELSLICDQRYNEEDMHRIVEEVKRGMSLC